jgi:hypothetical protein
MEWRNKNEYNPIVKRILVISRETNRIHIVHWDDEEWCLDETDNGSPGESIDFDYWMPLPKQPERSKREDIRNPFLDEIPECFISDDAVL